MNTATLFNTIEDLVLHRAPMLLLNSVVSWDHGTLTASVDPQDSYLFFDAQGDIPSWVGIEYMAQAISARAGIAALQRGEKPSVGFLLGTRKYTAQVSRFSPHQKLFVKVRELLRDETNLVLFECKIYADEILLASAEIKGIEPDNVNRVITQFRQMLEASGART